MTVQEINQNTKNRMLKTIESFKNDLGKIRTGRASPDIVKHLKVNSYGNDVYLSQVASITIKDQRTLEISPWDRSMIQPIEKAITQSDLGINPTSVGSSIYITIPVLTSERRVQLVKIAKTEAESARVSIRNARKEANNELKKLCSDKKISEDEERRGQAKIQELTDMYIGIVEDVLSEKEKDLTEI